MRTVEDAGPYKSVFQRLDKTQSNILRHNEIPGSKEPGILLLG